LLGLLYFDTEGAFFVLRTSLGGAKSIAGAANTSRFGKKITEYLTETAAPLPAGIVIRRGQEKQIV